MNLQSAKLVSETLALLTLAGCAVWVARDLHETNLQLRETISASNETIRSLNETVTAINAPCTSFHGSVTCGVLAQASQTEKDIGILAAQSALQVRQSSVLINGAAQAIQGAAGDVHTLATAATGTAQEATAAIGTVQTTIAQAQPVLESLNQSVQGSTKLIADADSRLRDPQIDALLTHIQGMSASGDKMLADAQWKEHELLHPTPAKGIKAFFGGVVLWIHRLTPPLF